MNGLIIDDTGKIYENDPAELAFQEQAKVSALDWELEDIEEEEEDEESDM